MTKATSFLLYASLISAFVSCGGSGSDGPDSGRFSGIWQVTYVPSDDTCGEVAPNLAAFVDRQIISGEDDSVEVQSTSGYVRDVVGSVEADGAFRGSGNFDEDFLGDGTPCSVTVALGYSNLDGDSATSLVTRDVVCADGFTCSVRAVGNAERQ